MLVKPNEQHKHSTDAAVRKNLFMGLISTKWLSAYTIKKKKAVTTK